ncbi:MAG TPA: hypothetical protein PKN33_16865 [Phycisphaerae bacterium]|nr:hypothetical protein [Phycisphaerae bacterium]
MSKRKRPKKGGVDARSPEPKPTSIGTQSNESRGPQESVENAGPNLDRAMIVRPSTDNGGSYLRKLFDSAQRELPEALADWERRITDWCDNYRADWNTASILEVDLRTAVYVFDYSLERVLLAYGLSHPNLEARDKYRMSRFPDVNIGAMKVMGVDAVKYDRGHFLGHAAGGELDINLFPQRRKLNQGRSPEGKLFRRMERYIAAHIGTFVYHRAMYNDETWIPDKLEYGLLVDGNAWWVETFDNKNPDA